MKRDTRNYGKDHPRYAEGGSVEDDDSVGVLTKQEASDLHRKVATDRLRDVMDYDRSNGRNWQWMGGEDAKNIDRLVRGPRTKNVDDE